MLLILSGIVISLLYIIKTNKKLDPSKVGLGVLLGSLASLGISILLPMNTSTRVTERKLSTLRTLNYQEVPGKFYVGCGNQDGRMLYITYVDTGKD